jgi:hypothetical protein
MNCDVHLRHQLDAKSGSKHNRAIPRKLIKTKSFRCSVESACVAALQHESDMCKEPKYQGLEFMHTMVRAGLSWKLAKSSFIDNAHDNFGALEAVDAVDLGEEGEDDDLCLGEQGVTSSDPTQDVNLSI